MYEESPFLSIEARDYLKGLIAKASYEALELLVVYDTERVDRSGDTRPESVPHTVALFAYRRGPALYMHMGYEQLVPTAHELINFKPEVVGRV